MERYLRAGIAIFNAGDFHEAHDAWEDRWLDLEAGSDDERFLHGLIQYTAAVHHATRDNREGATGLAESGRGYLADLPAGYRGVNVGAVREYLEALEDDPAVIDRDPPPRLTHDGEPLTVQDLGLPAVAVVARVFGEEGDYDQEIIDRAIAYARADRQADDAGSPFIPLLYDFAGQPEHRAVAYDRLVQHVQRRDGMEADVEGLFEE